MVLIGEIKGLNDEFKDLTKQLLNAHAAKSAHMDTILYYFAIKSSPS